jgi:hypothetical protein
MWVYVHREHRFTHYGAGQHLQVFSVGDVVEVTEDLGGVLLREHPAKFCAVEDERAGRNHSCEKMPEVATVVSEPPQDKAMTAPKSRVAPGRRKQARNARKRSGVARRAGVGRTPKE